jgi:hypothetical protein
MAGADTLGLNPEELSGAPQVATARERPERRLASAVALCFTVTTWFTVTTGQLVPSR